MALFQKILRQCGKEYEQNLTGISMGQSLGVCFGRTLIVYDVKNCENPGEIILEDGVSWRMVRDVK